MAALTITVANVATVAGTGENYGEGTASGTLTAGMPVYIDTANSNVIKACDANASLLASTIAGITLHGALTGQPIKYQKSGNITIGATVAVGTTYVAGATTAGDINPTTDLATGWYVSHVGIAISATVIQLRINNSGVAVP